MNLTEALAHIERIPTRKWDDLRLHILTHAPGAVGGMPGVGVAFVGAGIDWDSRRLLIHPEQPLTKLTPEQVDDITKSVRAGGSWHAYQRHKQQADRIAELERELRELKGGA